MCDTNKITIFLIKFIGRKTLIHFLNRSCGDSRNHESEAARETLAVTELRHSLFIQICPLARILLGNFSYANDSGELDKKITL